MHKASKLLFIFIVSNPSLVKFSSQSKLLSPPNEVYEITCVRPCVRPSVRAQNQSKNATSLSFLGRFWFCLFYLIGLGAGFKTSTQNFEIQFNYANLCKFIQNQLKKCYFSGISWPILILFVLSDRAWCGLQNFYTEFWNSLIMQIYANLFKINEKCHLSSIQKSQQNCTWGGDVCYASRNLLSTCFFSHNRFNLGRVDCTCIWKCKLEKLCKLVQIHI